MSKLLRKAQKQIIKIHPYGELLQNREQFKITDYISMGNYCANLHMTGSMFKGIPNNKVTMFAGETGSGKTYLTLNAVLQALRKGYSVFFFDTENAIDDTTLESFGIFEYWDLNPDSVHENFFTLIKVNIVEDLIHQMTGTVDMLVDAYKNGDYDLDRDKVMFAIDSIGMLATRKEIEDNKAQKEKADMTKAKKLTSFFRIITVPCGVLKAPVILTNHVYASLDPYAGPSIKGGNASVYAASNVLAMSKWNLKDDKDGRTKVGIRISAQPHKNRFIQPKKFDMALFFTRGMNEFYGLEKFFGPEANNICNFENLGIERGKMNDIKGDIPQFDENNEPIIIKTGKSAGKQKTKKGIIRQEFAPNNAKSGVFYVKHLGRKVTMGEFWSKLVFTDEILQKMDLIVAPTFKLSSKEETIINAVDSLTETDELEDE